MITSKERKTLSGMGQKISPVFQIGKNGIGENTINEISNLLEARELIKINILNNCDNKPREIIDALCDDLQAEPVSCIGNKIVIYRRSTRDGYEHIVF